jgi:hypothetical protein
MRTMQDWMAYGSLEEKQMFRTVSGCSDTNNFVYDIDGNTCAGGLVLPSGAGGFTPRSVGSERSGPDCEVEFCARLINGPV